MLLLFLYILIKTPQGNTRRISPNSYPPGVVVLSIPLLPQNRIIIHTRTSLQLVLSSPPMPLYHARTCPKTDITVSSTPPWYPLWGSIITQWKTLYLILTPSHQPHFTPHLPPPRSPTSTNTYPLSHRS